MVRRRFLGLVASALPVAWLAAGLRGSAAGADQTSGRPRPAAIPPLRKSLAEWRQLLPPAAYAVLFEEDTEAPWSSALNEEKRTGGYLCAACFLPLFVSATKFDSGTGWPSFYKPIEGRIGTKTDYKLIWPRTEYHCIRCGGHQGHVFNDGPQPTGQRWCNNGVALRFVPENEPLPELRT